jgi:glycosyltransferase involved in cell wall biosynthesis
MPFVSVVMPSYNYANYLPLAIDGVLSQTFADLELIIADDCSTDESREVAHQRSRNDKRVVTVFRQTNGGLACTRNTALEHVRGEFVAFCDADDIWLPHKLQTQVESLKLSSGAGFLHSDAQIIDSQGALTGQRFSQMNHRRGQTLSGDLFSELCYRNFICVPSVLVRNEAIQRVGGFDETLRSLEDWVCWTRIAKDCRFSYCKDPLVQYRVHSTSLSHQTLGMARNRVEAVQLLLRTLPDLSANLRAQLLYTLAMTYSELNEIPHARQSLKESLACNFLNARGWLRFCELAFRGN